MSHPNIVIVLVDQMRRNAMSGAGDINVCTPHLDKMMNEGVTFTNAMSTYPACVPFRFTLMTGKYAHSRNVPGLGFRLSPAERTLGEAIRAQGYATAYIGKWHLYSAYGVSGGLSLSQACRTPIPRTHRRGFDYWRGFELRNDFYDSWYFADDEIAPRKVEGHQTDGLFDLALGYLENDRPADRPFFLTLSIEAPHPPFVASPEALARVQARGPIRHAGNVDVGAIEFFPPEWYETKPPAGPLDVKDPASVQRVFEANMQAYYAMIEMIDDNMGRLRQTLERTGLAENTLVVFLADHGELGGSHGLLGKGQPHEESAGIPLVVHGPPHLVPGGRTVELPFATEDLYPTLVGLAGGSERPEPTAIDVSPLLRGEAGEPDRDAVLLQYVTEIRPGRGFYDETWRSVRTRTHKYSVIGNRAGARPWQLFDLAADPLEMNNLLDDPAAEGLAARLHARLIRLLDDTEDDYALASAFGHGPRRVVV